MEAATCLKETGYKYGFESPVNYEHSSGLVATINQNAKSEMELFAPDGVIAPQGRGLIEWIYCIGTDDEDVEYIGLDWEEGELTGYDGVFDLPAQAIVLLEQAGIMVGKEFRFDE